MKNSSDYYNPEYYKQYYQKNKEKIRVRVKKYNQKNKEKIAIHRKEFYQENREKFLTRARKYHQKNGDRFLVWKREDRKKKKLELLEAYGGAKCLKCGFTDIRALQLDHINGDGAKERRKLKYKHAGNAFYAYLRKNGYPDKDRYQVLCANCNVIKRIENKENGDLRYGNIQTPPAD